MVTWVSAGGDDDAVDGVVVVKAVAMVTWVSAGGDDDAVDGVVVVKAVAMVTWVRAGGDDDAVDGVVVVDGGLDGNDLVGPVVRQAELEGAVHGPRVQGRDLGARDPQRQLHHVCKGRF